MMQLKYLFDNRDLASMLLEYFSHDEGSEELFDYFRISSNAIYPYRDRGAICYLRFAPESEKWARQTAAELDYLRFLDESDYPSVRPLSSLTGDHYLRADTPWGRYHVSAFGRVPGEKLTELVVDPKIARSCGRSLGRLHRLTRDYTPKTAPWTHADALGWMREILTMIGDQEQALAEVSALEHAFRMLPQDSECYGLVHYDFERDNLFYELETDTCHVIDFDDAHAHWFAMDLTVALGDLEEEGDPLITEAFLAGYREEGALDASWSENRALFERYHNLYAYTRVLRATQDRWMHEPLWMIQLREKLEGILEKRRGRFLRR